MKVVIIKLKNNVYSLYSKYNTTMSRFIEQRLYTLDEFRTEFPFTSVARSVPVDYTERNPEILDHGVSP